jgi:hypothetical protein
MRDLSQGGGDGLDVILARDQVGRAFEIVTAAAFDAEDVGQEDGFPKFGTFLKARQPDDSGCWLELPQDLEDQLAKKMEKEEADGGSLEGLVFRVASARKTADGSWNYVVEWFESFQKASDSL